MKKKFTLLFIVLLCLAYLSYGQKATSGNELIHPRSKSGNSSPEKLVHVLNETSLEEHFEEAFPPFAWYQTESGGFWDQSDQIEDNTSGEGYFARFDCFNIQQGNAASLVTPPLQPSPSKQKLEFALNHYLVEGSYGNEAQFYVDISSDFGETWSNITGDILAVDITDSSWVEQSIDLADYTGVPVQLRFRAVSDYGSYNIGIDDVSGPDIYELENDPGLVEIIRPKGVTNTGDRQITLLMQNYGTADLTSADLKTYIRDTINRTAEGTVAESWNGVLPSKETKEVQAGRFNFSSSGFYSLTSIISNPNDATDSITANNKVSERAVVIEPGQVFEDFETDKDVPDNWTADEDGWQPVEAYAVSGSKSYWLGQADGDPAKMLISPKMKVGAIKQLRFMLNGLNNIADYGGSTLSVKYASEKDGTWQTLKTFDMVAQGSNPRYHSIDLSSLADGEYYFAFEGKSNFSYQTYNSYIIVDDVMGTVDAGAKTNDLAVVDVAYPTDFIYSGENVQIDVVVRNTGIEAQEGRTVELLINGTGVASDKVASISYYETDTIAFTYKPGEAGLYSIKGRLADDQNPANNALTVTGLVVEKGNLVEGFENPPLMDSIGGWASGDGWDAISQQDGTSAFNPYQGDSSYVCNGGGPGAYENVKLITPRVAIDEYSSALRFHSKYVNSNDSSATRIAVYYRKDLEEGDWKPVGNTFTLTENWEMYEVSMRKIPDGEYHLAFFASSTYDNPNYSGYAMLDHVSGLSLPRPKVQYQLPFPGTSSVALDSIASVKFSEKVSAIDLSEVQIKSEANGELEGVSASLGDDQRTLAVKHDGFSSNNALYTVRVPVGAVKNGRHTKNKPVEWSFTTIMKKPGVAAYFPDSASSGAALDIPASLLFNQRVEAVDLSGITITGETEGAVGNIDAQLNNEQLVIKHNQLGNYSETYTVHIPAGTVKNRDGKQNEAISWSFTTKEEDQPAVAAVLPMGAATGIERNSGIYAVFDEAVAANDLSGIALEGENSGSVAVTGLELSGDTLFFQNDTLPERGELYSVTLPAGAVRANGKLNERFTWSFRTLKPSPYVVSSDPLHWQTAVATNKKLELVFNEEIFAADMDRVQIKGEQSGEVKEVVSAVKNEHVLEITHDAFAYGETLALEIPEGTVQNYDGAVNKAFSIKFVALHQAEYSEDFSGNPFAGEIKLFNGDEATPASAPDALVDSAFIIRENSAFKSRVAIGTSAYSPGSAANDWMVLPGIELEGYAALQWEALSLDPDEEQAEQYRVFLVSENQDTLLRELQYEVKGEAFASQTSGNQGKSHIVNLFEDAGEKVFIAFNLNTPAPGADRLALDNIRVSKAHRVTFTITDGNAGLKQAEVILRGDTLKTGENGKVAVRLPEGAYAYKANASGFLAKEDTLKVNATDMEEVVQLSLTFHEAAFTVVDEESPIEAAAVEIAGNKIKTETEGQAAILLKNGTYPYSVEAKGYYPVSDTILVDDMPVSEKISMEKRAYPVVFDVTSDGIPVKNADVKVADTTLITALDGTAEFALTDGTYPFSADARGYFEYEGEIAVNGEKAIVQVDLLISTDWEFFPNPAGDNVYIKFGEKKPGKLEIRSIEGKLMLEQKLKNGLQRFNTSTVPSGVYLLQVITDEKTYRRKIIINN